MRVWCLLVGLLLPLGLGIEPAAADSNAAAAAGVPAPAGRPRIILDHLGFPADAPRADYFTKRLREILRRESRRVVWGAGEGNTITYRYFVTGLTVTQQGDVVRVHCQATGQLPKGKTAKSTLTFSGAASQRDAVVLQVLDIVARGVIARLAELERTRRGVACLTGSSPLRRG